MKISCFLKIVIVFISLNCHAEQVRLTFLHFNDIYEIDAKEGRGGFPQLMTALKEERTLSKNAMTVVTGDFISPSLFSPLFKGKQIISLFNSMGVDLVTFGNHEFDYGPVILRKRMEESLFPWVSSNVLDKNGNLFGCSIPYYIKEINGLKVGFGGIVTPTTQKILVQAAGIKIKSPVAAAREVVKKLQTEGADVIILLTHLDLVDDQKIAKKVPNIDLILGGHEHDPTTFLRNGVLLHKSGTDGEYLGVIHLDVAVNRNGFLQNPRKVIPSWSMRSIHGLNEDLKILEIVNYFNEALRKDVEGGAVKTESTFDTE